MNKLKAEAELRAKQHKQSLVPGDTSDPNAAWYVMTTKGQEKLQKTGYSCERIN